MKTLRHLLPLLLALAFGGCASKPNQVSAESLSNAPADNGILVASYARPSPNERFSTENVLFRKKGQRRWREIGINTLPLVPLKFDFQNEDSCGSLYVVSLPAGDYEIYDFSVIQSVFGGTIMHSPSSPFSIPFTVGAGKISYLGELKIDRIEAAKFLGLPGSDQVRFDLSDQNARDIAILHGKYPELTAPVEIVKPGPQFSNPFIRIE